MKYCERRHKWNNITLALLLLVSFTACNGGKDREALDESNTSDPAKQGIVFTEGLELELPEADGTLLSVVSADSESTGQGSADFTRNETGLIGAGLKGLHDNSTEGWLTKSNGNPENAWISYDLGSNRHVGEIYVWNCNQRALTDCGLKNIKIEYRLDGSEEWIELRNTDQMANDTEYPYVLAKASGENGVSYTNLADDKGPISVNRWARYIRFTAQPERGEGNYGGSSFGLSEVKFTEGVDTKAQYQARVALNAVGNYNPAIYLEQSYEALNDAVETLKTLYYHDDLTNEEVQPAIDALHNAVLGLEKREDVGPYTDLTFSESAKFDPVLDRQSNAEMSLQVANGALYVDGMQTANGAARIYRVVAKDLSIPVTENTKLTYHIMPDLDTGHDFPSLHLAVDLLFDDGTYLSELSVEDENGVGINPDDQGKGLAMVTRHDNLIIVKLGDYEQCRGKAIRQVLVGYENHTGTAGREFSASLDNIVIEEYVSTMTKPTDYVRADRGTNSHQHGISRGFTWTVTSMPNPFNYWRPDGDGITCTHMGHAVLGEVFGWKLYFTNGQTGGTNIKERINLAHYNSVTFEKTGIGQMSGLRYEIAPTDHAASIRITYDQSLAARGVNLNGLQVDPLTGTFSGEVYDMREGESWYKGTIHTMYVYGTFDTPIESVDGSTAYFAENPNGETVVTVSLATSFISAEQAKTNFELEIAGKDFDTVCAEAEEAWLQILGKIEIEGATEDQMISFYSNLYRVYLYPTNLGEFTGDGEEGGWQYRSPYDNEIADGKMYYNNGFWDTYRTVWPLYSLLTPDLTAELIGGFVEHYEECGWIPRWSTVIGVNCMCGSSFEIASADALMRGVELPKETLDLLYESSLKSATLGSSGEELGGRPGSNLYNYLGYVYGLVSETTAAQLNDFGIAQLAKIMGDQVNYEYFQNRSLSYTTIFDTINQWFRSRTAEEEAKNLTNWESPLYPIDFSAGYLETFAYSMAFEAVWDVQGMLNMYGGQQEMKDKLDDLFDCWDAPRSGVSAEASGEMVQLEEVKMGAYHHNNQPAHHVPYMYLVAGKPTKTQEKVRQVLRQCYIGSQNGQGYIGDEDNGEQSAWYVFSSMGLYPLNVGMGELVFGSPLFDKVTIHLENGNDIVINAPYNNSNTVYVKSLQVNGKAYDKTSILQTTLTENGAIIDFEMTDDASSCTWGTAEDSIPTSVTEGTDGVKRMTDATGLWTEVVKDATVLDVNKDSIYVNKIKATSMIDNNSQTSTTLKPVDGVASVHFYFAQDTKVTMYTITSPRREDANVPGDWKLYGSSDGENWVLLDSESGVQWTWTEQLKAFKIDVPQAYKQYRLDFATEEKISVAEIELLAY